MRKTSLILLIGLLFSVIISGCAKDPTACFSASETDVEVNTKIEFTNCSEKGVYYEWNFGDSTISSRTTAKNASHSYSASGTYTITLTTSNRNGKKTNSVTETITVRDINEKFVGTYNMMASCIYPSFNDTLYGGAYTLTIVADGAENLKLDNFENEFTGIVAKVTGKDQIDILFQVVAVGDTVNWDLTNASATLNQNSLSISYTLDDSNWDNVYGAIGCNSQGLKQ